MALSFIGKPISLISHSDVRYRGILAGIDPAASTIQLSNVYSMGTEMRRPPSEFIPPVQEPYQYIIFRASEVKDLSVDEPAPLRSVHDDPAVLGASAPTAANGYSQYPPTVAPVAQPVPQQQPRQQPYAPQQPQQQPQQPQQPQQQQQQQQQQPQPATPGPARSGGSDGRRTANFNGSGSVQTAAASLETVGRALGDLRNSTASANPNVNSRGGGGGRRGGNNSNRDVKVGDIRVPTTDFDFEGSNARFDKSAIAPPSSAKVEGGNTEEGEVQEEEAPKAYNPGKSFFDSLSSSTQAQPPVQRGSGRGGRGGGRNRREEEREKNVATFGEPGGVGLMGPELQLSAAAMVPAGAIVLSVSASIAAGRRRRVLQHKRKEKYGVGSSVS
ncbi:Scd6-like Sm domain-containing protein [Multifurca ochricompacta]|uniref:Scd6-like Sm domain-containing protein n=1 Tax=Multifurca ochricompacta TaxID=376703 RepID=A0AAD4MA41_9AGAM|nr:Scd6-like Sm domain-containing protein [Multifurca ochricompacta]